MAEGENPQKTYKQHPIPQNVLGVEFKLVGELTLRQFLYVGGAILLAYLIYSTSLPTFVSYPLSLTIALLGLAAAFLPIQNQSFDQWLVHFFTALTTPTQRVWRKIPNPPDFFLFSYAPSSAALRAPAAKDRARLQEYLKTLKAPAAVTEKNELDLAEENFLKKLGLTPPPPPSAAGLPPPSKSSYQPFVRPPRKTPQEFNLASEISYAQGGIIAVPGEKHPHYIPSLSHVRVGRKLGTIMVTSEGAAPVQGEIELAGVPKPEMAEERLIPLSPQEKEDALKKQLAELEAKMEILKKEKPPLRPPVFTAYTKTLPGSYLKIRSGGAGPESEMEKLRRENLVLKEKLQAGEEISEEKRQADESEERYRANFSRLSEKNSRLQEELEKAQAALEKMQTYAREVSAKDPDFQKRLKEQEEKLDAVRQEEAAAGEALASLGKERHRRRAASSLTARAEDLRGRLEPPPPPPAPKMPPLVKDAPNIINGVVKNHRGELLEGAVVIVKDEMDEPVRALKTNKVGQFIITTPVANGRYQISVAAGGEVFDIMIVNVLGEVLEPLEFTGKPPAYGGN